MVELSVRFLIAGALVFLSGLTGYPMFDSAWKIAIGLGLLAGTIYYLDAKKLRSPSIAGLLATGDSALLASTLAGIPHFPGLESFGCLTLVPCLWAAWKHRASGLLMAPVVAMCLLVTDSANHMWQVPPNLVIGQAVAILVVGLLIQPYTRGVQLKSENVGDPTVQDLDISEFADHMIEMRENYRQLRDAYRDLDRKTKRDQVCAQLAEVRGTVGGNLLEHMLDRTVSLSGADGAVLYVVAQFADTMVVKCTSGKVAEAQKVESLEVSTKQAIAIIQHQADQLTRSLQSDALTTNLVIQHQGRVVGMLSLTARGDDKLMAAIETANLTLPMFGSTIVEEQRRVNVERRLQETETLYAVVATADGATTKTEIASRLVRDLAGVLEADNVAVFAVDENELLPLATDGRPIRLLELMSFANGAGIQGWIETGAPELNLMDVRKDQRFPAEASLRARVGSYCVQPILVGDQLFGILSAASIRVGGLDIGHVETLRAAAAELSRLFTKMDRTNDLAEGILAPKDFAEVVAERSGYMVTLDPMRLAELETKFGKPALTHAMRQLGLRIRARAPQGSIICRHPSNLFLVFIETEDGTAPTSWANEMAAIGPQIGIRTPDGTTRIPIDIRAKVARYSPQNSQVLLSA